MSQRLKTLWLSLALLAANLWVAKGLLASEFINQMGSIEGTHIAIGRFVLNHWPDLFWFPLWYGGIPFPNTYAPLHPLLVAVVAGVGGLSPALAYHALTAVFYALGPVCLFLLALRLSGSRAYSLAAALIYSFSSSSVFLIPSVARDVGGFWHARRLQALVQYGEGPHIASLALFPLALLLLVVAFQKRRPLWWMLATAALAAVVLTNWLGGFALAVAAAAWLSTTTEPAGRKKWMMAVGLGVCAYAIACPWFPPSTIWNTFAAEVQAGGSAEVFGRWGATLAGVFLFVALGWLLRRRSAPSAFSFSVLFLFAMAFLTLAAEWGGIHILHQASRLHLEMEVGLALAASFGAMRILKAAPPSVRRALGGILLLVAAYGAIRCHAYARRLYHRIDIRQTIEYREAKWISENLKDARVMAPGSVGFFLNVFSDTPQFDGGYYQGAVNPLLPHVRYQIYTGQDAGPAEDAIAVAWLKAFGVHAVGVSGPHSQEVYKPFNHPDKFKAVLPVLWRDGDDVVYQVPCRTRSLAHVVGWADLPARPPESGLDVDPARPYLRALDDPTLPPATLHWRNQHTAVISAPLRREQLLSVQISYHPGWTATVDGQPRRVLRDHLGQLAVVPECEGPCTVEMAFHGGREMLWARIVGWAVVLGGFLWMLLCGKQRKPA